MSTYLNRGRRAEHDSICNYFLDDWEDQDDILINKINNKSIQDTAERNVLFWIHGGGYTVGDSRTYSGIKQAVDYGNIVVNIQYR